MKFKIAPGLVQLAPTGEGHDRLTSDEYMTFGHAELVRVVTAATAEVIAALGPRCRNKVVVKDLNTADGKPAQGHKTHGPGGRNVDLGYFYRMDGYDDRVENRFINHKELDYRIGQGGRCLRAPHPLWDLEANWLLVLALLGHKSVKQILVDQVYVGPLEQRASAAARDEAERQRALKTIQFFGNHDNHFHLDVSP